MVPMRGADDPHVNVRPATWLPFPSSATALNRWVRPMAVSVALAGLTTTDRTTCDTVRVAAPETPAAVAVISAAPFPTAVARPPASTVATSPSDDVHVNDWPGTTLPFASLATALNCCVSPSTSSVADAGVTTTDVTACSTDSVAVPDTPPVVAVMVVTPFASAVARPVAASTVATAGDEDVQLKICPAMVFPFASFAVALNCCGRPSASSVTAAGLTSTRTTTWETLRIAVPGTPAVVAVIVANPFPSAVATPVAASITATPVGAALHVNVWPGAVLPFASLATAPNCCVKPRALSVAVAGVTTTDLTICATETAAIPETAPVVAVIVAAPFPTAVARPAGSTVATSPSDDVHVNVRPRTGRPFPSSGTALNCWLRPRALRVALAGLTSTDRTICATDMAAVPETPPFVAVIVAVPFPAAVASPPASTVATSPSEDVHVNGCPGTTLPLASFATALNC